MSSTPDNVGTVLLVGTRKGMWIGTSDERREDWHFTGPHHDMEEVYSCMVDKRGDRPRLLSGASSSWLGPQVRRSDDLGGTWQESPDGAIRFPEDVDASVERVWQLVPGAEPGVVYAGSEPGAISSNSDLAMPAPNCTDRMPTSTSQTGEARRSDEFRTAIRSI
jgi:hypothetical protein